MRASQSGSRELSTPWLSDVTHAPAHTMRTVCRCSWGGGVHHAWIARRNQTAEGGPHALRGLPRAILLAMHWPQHAWCCCSEGSLEEQNHRLLALERGQGDAAALAAAKDPAGRLGRR